MEATSPSAIVGLKEISEETIERIRDYLALINEDVKDFEVATYGEYETVRFELRASPPSPALRFDAASMSDGTLRRAGSAGRCFPDQLAYRADRHRHRRTRDGASPQQRCGRSWTPWTRRPNAPRFC